YSMRNGRERVLIQECSILHPKIQEILKEMLFVFRNEGFGEFISKLFAIEVLYVQTSEALITFIYHKKLQESWLVFARRLQQILEDKLLVKMQLIGRSKGVKLVLDRDYVVECLTVCAKQYWYCYYEGIFTQPNPKMNEKMIEWVLNQVEESESDLLELYCGCGNFTIPLAQKFRKVLATEVSKTSIKALKWACSRNEVLNVESVRLSGEECMKAINGERSFRRLQNIALEEYVFKTIFVDPPRSGLGEEICNFLQTFEQIFYISCNPITLARDLQIIQQTHKIISLAFFDQFPHTKHLESGIFLIRK
ncbi:MAG: tRNA (uridine(54)-C5)-methyltransferase TrmA, partial [Helicobacter sp.]|nr:tRNA (uridine(54)-C5)-methyltransferase TrmA [Helicobacter sp.]